MAIAVTWFSMPTDSIPQSLPYLAPTFVGRQNETSELLSFLQYTPKSPRIVSITGGPGFGESTLAICVGRRLADQGVKVIYVNMNDVTSKQALAEKILLSVSEREFSVTIDRLYSWSKHLNHQTLLIVMNSFTLTRMLFRV